MCKRSKIILGVLLAVGVLLAATVGVVLAQGSGGDDTQAKPRYQAMLDRVAEIYQTNTGDAIDPQQLKDAFAQALKELRQGALDGYLQRMVDEGRITKEQADQYKSWLEAMPDLQQFREQQKEWRNARPGIPPELKQWQDARPDVPLTKRFGRGNGHRGYRGFGGGMRLGGASF